MGIILRDWRKKLKKTLGKILHAVASGLSYVFDFLINIINIIVIVFEGLKQVLFFIGCSVIFIFPIFFFAIPRNLMVLIILAVLIPFLGTRFVSALRYANYTVTEWMYDKADTLISGKKVGFKNFKDYGDKYRFDEETRERRQAEGERQRQQEEMNRKFEEFAKNFRFYDNYSQDSSNSYDSSGYYQTGASDIGFKEKYEKACDTLGVTYDSDSYQIKLNFRKLAKQYHPDISDDPNATEKFQEINEAYEFLSNDNINKYKSRYK